MTKFKVGDKLRYKIEFIDLTFELIGLDSDKYTLRTSKGEVIECDFFHGHEVLEVAE